MAEQISDLPGSEGATDLSQEPQVSHIDAAIAAPAEHESRRFSKEDRKNFEPPKDENGQFFCDYPDPLNGECANLRFNRKCEYHKHMDKHLRPHVCQVPDCKQPGFTYPGGLRRHEAEVHGMHGGPKEVLYCPYPFCKRNSGEPFTRRENMQEHISRLHQKSKESKEAAGDATTTTDGAPEGDKTEPTNGTAATPGAAEAAAAAETLAVAASASANAINPNIDPAFTQDATAPPAAAAQPTPTPPQPKGKKRKTTHPTFKTTDYTPASAAQDASILRQLAELSDKVHLLEEQNGRLHLHNGELVDENNYLRDSNVALRDENTNLREALTAAHASS